MTGLPTIEQVREHAAHGGIWRFRYTEPYESTPSYSLAFVLLSVHNGEIMWDGPVVRAVPVGARHGNFTREHQALTHDWTPCDRDGNPLALVEAAKARQHELALVLHHLAALTDDDWCSLQLDDLLEAFRRGDHRQHSAEVSSE